ncbi:porin family protein [Hymenobacter elongatus]|uniref:PorT family protein n=1 Tax=Hymenobacter elongatus TaxID=877208 RepID=A0A4Z0PIW2_9BACT|nr:porin family protein [Hymenobacter elongatus]TGE14837.1 PorT family protein [Hymenobacter elongatus]
MKRIFLSAMLLVGLAATASAQTPGSIGVKAGFNYSSIEGKNIDLDYRPGYSAGFFLNAPLTADGALSVQQEVSYSLKGSKAEKDGAKEDLRLGYIEAPLVIRYKKSNFFVEGGVQAGILVTTDYTLKFQDETFSTDKSSDLKLNTFDLGYVGGVGYQMGNGFQGGVRYSRSFIRIFNDNALLGGSKAANSAFQLYVGYSINGK